MLHHAPFIPISIEAGLWQALEVEVDGRKRPHYLVAVVEELKVEQLRCIALVSNVPIHSYMFDQHGRLMYATGKANMKLKAAGAAHPCTSPCLSTG